MEALKSPHQDPSRLRHIFLDKSVTTLCGIHHKDLLYPNTKSIIITDFKTISYIDRRGKLPSTVEVLLTGDKSSPWITVDSRKGPFVSPQPLCIDCYGMFLLAST